MRGGISHAMSQSNICWTTRSCCLNSIMSDPGQLMMAIKWNREGLWLTTHVERKISCDGQPWIVRIDVSGQ